MNTKSIGKRLKALRAEHGWSQEECAEQIGISTRYLADIERGSKTPKLATLITILNTLTASADDVLQDSLTVGYASKSNELLKRLEPLSPAQRKQALDIFDGVIHSLKNTQ